VTREVLQMNASADCDGAAAREVQYLRQRSELLEGRLEQGRQGVLILENEISSLINHGQRSELEARLRDEQAMEMAHNRQIAQVSAMLQHATREMEESDFQKRATLDRLSSVEHKAEHMLAQAEYHIQARSAGLAEAHRSAEEWEQRAYSQRREFEEHDFRASGKYNQMEQYLHREGEALAGSNRVISERNESLRQETFAARRLRQTSEELQTSLRDVIAARDRYRLELHEGPALDSTLRQQLEAMRGRLQ
jgi:hypothetical protein